MPRTPLREAAGVKLFEVQDLSTGGRIPRSRYELVIPSSAETRVFDDETSAHKAFEHGLAAASHPSLGRYGLGA